MAQITERLTRLESAHSRYDLALPVSNIDGERRLGDQRCATIAHHQIRAEVSREAQTSFRHLPFSKAATPIDHEAEAEDRLLCLEGRREAHILGQDDRQPYFARHRAPTTKNGRRTITDERTAIPHGGLRFFTRLIDRPEPKKRTPVHTRGRKRKVLARDNPRLGGSIAQKESVIKLPQTRHAA